MNAYQIYLMIELAKLANVLPIDLEYDLMWGKGGELYSEFQSSEYDNDSKSEYDCIVEFLDNKAKTMELDTKIHLDRRLEAAKKILADNGFYTDNLWHIDDVKAKFDCTDEEAMEVLDNAMRNDATREQVSLAIEICGDANGLEEKEEED